MNPCYGFITRQVELLGDRDPLEVLAETPARLRRLAAERPPDAFGRRPAPGVWSPLDIVTHLADMEWVFGFRMRTILCDDGPALAGVDQGRWAALGAPRHAGEAIEMFADLRRWNLAFWRRLAPDQLERAGRHAEAGLAIPLHLLRRIQAGHDLSHLGQIDER